MDRNGTSSNKDQGMNSGPSSETRLAAIVAIVAFVALLFMAFRGL